MLVTSLMLTATVLTTLAGIELARAYRLVRRDCREERLRDRLPR